MQYNYNYNAIQYKTVQCHVIQYNTIHLQSNTSDINSIAIQLNINSIHIKTHHTTAQTNTIQLQ